MADATFWNGKPCPCRRLRVRLPDSYDVSACSPAATLPLREFDPSRDKYPLPEIDPWGVALMRRSPNVVSVGDTTRQGATVCAVTPTGVVFRTPSAWRCQEVSYEYAGRLIPWSR